MYGVTFIVKKSNESSQDSYKYKKYVIIQSVLY